MDAETLLSSDYRYIRPIISDKPILDIDFLIDINERGVYAMGETDKYIYIASPELLSRYNKALEVIDKEIIVDGLPSSMVINGNDVYMYKSDRSLSVYKDNSEKVEQLEKFELRIDCIYSDDIYIYLSDTNGILSRYNTQNMAMDKDFSLTLTGSAIKMHGTENHIYMHQRDRYLVRFNKSKEIIDKTIMTSGNPIDIKGTSKSIYLVHGGNYTLCEYDIESESLKELIDLKKRPNSIEVADKHIYICMSDAIIKRYALDTNVLESYFKLSTVAKQMLLTDEEYIYNLQEDGALTRFNGNFYNHIGWAMA